MYKGKEMSTGRLQLSFNHLILQNIALFQIDLSIPCYRFLNIRKVIFQDVLILHEEKIYRQERNKLLLVNFMYLNVIKLKFSEDNFLVTSLILN